MSPSGWNLGPNLQVQLGSDGIAELVFGPDGAMPYTDAAAHAGLATIWRRLE
jgi:hypothetical protein